MANTRKSAVKSPTDSSKKVTKASAKKSAGSKAVATKKAPSKSASRPSAARKASSGRAAPARDKKTKDPKGGLTQAGREYFAKTEGSHLKPGVKGPADTPEKKKRKGSFLRRHFANPRGPMETDGKPTRLAISAQAWGEPLPKTAGDARKLAAKGKKLLEQYHSNKAGTAKK